MNIGSRNVLSLPGVPSLLEQLCHGRLAWELVHPFPTPSAGDAELGDESVARVRALLGERLDPERVEAENRLPDGLVPALADEGLLNLLVDEAAGGRGLSPYNAFRVMTAAAEQSVATGMLLAIHNGIGAAAYLPILPAGPLRDFVTERVRAGTVTGMADTEPGGAANRARELTAQALSDGSGYLLNGEKLYIGNGSVAGVLAVTATVHENGSDRIRVFFVDTATPGFSVRSSLEFMGLRGSPNGALSFRDVLVPAERLLQERDGQWLTPERAVVLSRGRVFIVGAPSLAIARRCVALARAYATRRRVDGRNLGGYDEVQRMIAASLADVYALDSMARWVMLADQDGRAVNLMLEQVAAKDVTSLLCWRVAERTMTLLAGEGFETVAGKIRRGGPGEPMERLYRDARGMRVAGGTEVLLQMRVARNIVFSYFYPEPHNVAEIESEVEPTVPEVPQLSPRNREHLRFTATEIRRFARACLRLCRRYPDPAVLYERGSQLRLVGQLAEELVTMVVTLGRAASGADDGEQDLADIYCAQARRRLAAWWHELADADAGEPAHAATSDRWLADGRSPAVPDDAAAEAAGAGR
ncbi:acyl-CoA/acyl-ACP dehydrogenase [Micromonospora sp. C31]|uniref:acyl-CoA dehydrogenase family protein n=1 Tax=Micromonospora sp. C31 TaxID=2824876 RepID=UPI001B399FAB|nr:acyl-CoA dehydrogenase family protein [Micromonospora sp. C31]MBQ1075634.1 acyl-CoA/acyl-ACP dehydrogenase [Micromonospora sp. C31]